MRNTRGRIATMIVMAGLAAVACGGGSEVNSEAAAASTEAGIVETRVGCEFGPYFPLSVLDSAPPTIEDSTVPEVAAAIAPFLESGEGEFWPQDDWRVLEVVLEDVVQLVAVGTGEEGAPGLAFMAASWEDDAWRWSGSGIPGDCELVFEAATDGSLLEWELDPAGDHGPESTTILVTANELACASGNPVGDRLRDPVVTLTDTEVRILLTADPLEGDQDCPSNPSQQVTIELDEPIGDRAIVDGRSSGLGDLEQILTDLIAAEGQ